MTANELVMKINGTLSGTYRAHLRMPKHPETWPPGYNVYIEVEGIPKNEGAGISPVLIIPEITIESNVWKTFKIILELLGGSGRDRN